MFRLTRALALMVLALSFTGVGAAYAVPPPPDRPPPAPGNPPVKPPVGQKTIPVYYVHDAACTAQPHVGERTYSNATGQDINLHVVSSTGSRLWVNFPSGKDYTVQAGKAFTGCTATQVGQLTKP